jgi:hypothetical protein
MSEYLQQEAWFSGHSVTIAALPRLPSTGLPDIDLLTAVFQLKQTLQCPLLLCCYDTSENGGSTLEIHHAASCEFPEVFFNGQKLNLEPYELL